MPPPPPRQIRVIPRPVTRLIVARVRHFGLPVAAAATYAVQWLGRAALTLAPQRLRARAATLAGTGTLTLGAVRARARSVLLSAAGTLTLAVHRAKPRAVALAGAGALLLQAMRRRERAPTFAGTGTLTVGALRQRFRSAALQGLATLTLATVRPRARSVALTGTGTLAVGAARARLRSATFSGVGTLTLGAQKIPGTSYVFDENCEGTGTPTGWTDSGSPSWDYTTTVLEGSHSLQLDSADTTVRALGSSYSTLWGFQRFRTGAAPGANTIIWRARDSGNTTRASIQYRTTGNLAIQTNNGAQTAAGPVISADTTYCLWWEYAAGTGANGVFRLWVSEDVADKGTVDVQITNGSHTAELTNILFGSSANGTIWDTMKGSTTEIPNSPP